VECSLYVGMNWWSDDKYGLILHSIIERKLKQWWSTPILTERKTTSHLKSLYTNKKQQNNDTCIIHRMHKHYVPIADRYNQYLQYFFLKFKGLLLVYICSHCRSKYQEMEGQDPVSWFNSPTFFVPVPCLF
jgi:hypothetical protein